MQRIIRESRCLIKTYTFIFLALCFFGNIFLTKANAATIEAKSCSFIDVQNAVDSADRGDTVVVPAGECSWNKTLSVNKSITLRGAGSNATRIVSTFRQNNKRTDEPFISFNGTANDSGVIFRLTGFQFDAAHYTWTEGGAKCHYATQILHVNAPATVSIRVDNNRFINLYRVNVSSSCTMPGGTYNSQKSVAMHLAYVKGVIDNNYFQGYTSIRQTRWGGAWTKSTWSGWDNGTDDNIFVEDNTFVHTVLNQISLSDQSGSMVWRYNDVDYTKYAGTYFYPFDTHGHQEGPTFASFGGELYGNKIIANSDQGFNIIEHRGGRLKAFYNKSTTNAGGVRIRTLWGDDTSVTPSATSFGICPTGSLYQGIKVCGIDGRTQHPEKTYIWNNRKSNNNFMNVINTKGAISWSNPKLLRENREWWIDYGTWSESISYNDTKKTGVYANDVETEYRYTFQSTNTFDGSSGIGCGAIEQRPSRCTPGVGYWATNQSCSSVPTGMYGKNPTTPIQGTLYICGENNNWVDSYKPYTYPHPLRSGSTETISAPKGFKLVN